jgi:hypothetical protein
MELWILRGDNQKILLTATVDDDVQVHPRHDHDFCFPTDVPDAYKVLIVTFSAFYHSKFSRMLRLSLTRAQSAMTRMT